MTRRRFLISVAIAALSWIVAVLISRVFGSMLYTPGVPFVAAVALSTLTGGFVAGFLCTILGIFSLQWFIPSGTGRSDLVSIFTFAATGFLICFGNGMLRWSRGRIEKAFSRSYALQLELERERHLAQEQAAELQRANATLQRLHERSQVAEQELRDQQNELTRAYDNLREQQSDLTFLLSASTLLSESMDYERNLTILARLSLPKLGEWCAIDIVQENDKGVMALRRITSQHRDPQMQALLTEMDRRYPHLRDAPAGPANVVRTGQKELINIASDEIIASLAEDEEHLQMLRQLGFRSVMIVPLMARGRRLGAMSFYSSRDRQFDLTDLDLAEDLTRRAAYYVDNAQLYQQVRAADRRKDEFLATLAHELRNPLAPIMNAFEILRKRVGDHPELDPLHETVRRQIQHLVRLINDLVDVSRITRGKIALRMERVRLETLVHQAVDTSQPLIDARRQKLTLNLSPEPLWLSADPARLVQVIANLLNNASKYTHAGGCIWLITEREGEQAILRVRDNGSGIETDLLPQVFDLFTQGDRSLDRVQGGLGIGLTIVRSLVEDHHGQVVAFSEGQGRGSEFVVRLPIIAEGARPELAEPQGVRAGPPRRIVVVEDNRDARETLERLLALDGHAVLTADDGPTGLERILSTRPEVALVDVGLPRLDGYGVASEVRKQLGSAVQLVALTGYGNPEDRQRAFLSGFDSHLVKPVTLDDLRRILMPAMPSGTQHQETTLH